MKKYLIIILVALPFMTFAQYPAPTNFEYTLEYFEIGEWGGCGDEYIEGPGYCSFFIWNVPDTVGLSTNL